MRGKESKVRDREGKKARESEKVGEEKKEKDRE